jgi:uncharacterized Fe-S cluster-containing radical SAM superfamily protein
MADEARKTRVSSYLSPRHGSNAWAQRDDVVAAWKRGSQEDVPPMTAEYAPIVSCNADCYGCPYRRSRLKLGDGIYPFGARAPENDIQASTRDTAVRILETAREGGVSGFLWTGGGEPTIWGPLLDMLSYSANLGMANALYTNGFVFGTDPEYVHRLLSTESGLVFVRMSINAVSPRLTKIHWGVDPEEVRPQLGGLARLLQARNRLKPSYGGKPVPSIQVSTIIDRRNVDDLLGVCETVARIFGENRREAGGEDRFIVRPMTFHGRPLYSAHDHPEHVIQRVLEVCGANGAGRQVLRDAGVEVFMGFGLPQIESGAVPSYAALIESAYAGRGVSLASGLFLVVGPSGRVYLSTEHNCDDNWSFGNLLKGSVADIYRSEARHRLLALVNSHRWGPDVAQPTSRTARLDRVAVAVRDGLLSDEDISYIRQVSVESHPLILD